MRKVLEEGLFWKRDEGLVRDLRERLKRNELVHAYDEERAREIFGELKNPEISETFSEVLKGIKGD